MAITLTLRGNIELTIPTGMSVTRVDIQQHDAINYRDLPDANTIGAGRSLQVTGSGVTDAVVLNGEPKTVTGTGATIATSGNDPHIDENDMITHVAPRPEERTYSMIYVWTGTGGTGSKCAEYWAKNVIGWAIDGEATYIS